MRGMKGKVRTLIDDKIITLTLEVNCKKCDGTGWENPKVGYVHPHQCEECNGQGYLLTETGRQILDLVMKHITFNQIEGDW